jgi:hypothetical protein
MNARRRASGEKFDTVRLVVGRSPSATVRGC